MVTDEEETEGETTWRRQSDTAIACQLVRGGYLVAAKFDVWRRSRAGATIHSMRHDYPNEVRAGGLYCERSLYRWVQEVDAAIAAARVAEAPAVEVRERHTISVASGHEVRDAANPVPAGRVSTEASSWDAERLRAAGVVDRFSRKQK